jgi:hypothetical protein
MRESVAKQTKTFNAVGYDAIAARKHESAQWKAMSHQLRLPAPPFCGQPDTSWCGEVRCGANITSGWCGATQQSVENGLANEHAAGHHNTNVAPHTARVAWERVGHQSARNDDSVCKGDARALSLSSMVQHWNGRHAT